MICYTKNKKETISGSILFLGDSITNMGEYISFLNTYFKLSHADSDITLINAGVSSETVSGLSEPDHPFDRPCVKNRVERAVSLIKPNWVVLGYGINDGIYYPLNKSRFDCFKSGYISLVKWLKDQGCKVIVMTPMPFDAPSFSGDLAEQNEEPFSYMKPYKYYNDVMNEYAKWIMQELSDYADKTIDLFTPLSNDIRKMREQDPTYSSGDGIHPNSHGHLVMAQTILKDYFHIQTDTFWSRMEMDNYALFHMIYKRDNLFHIETIESIGHDNPCKSERLEKEVLEQEVQKLNLQIENYITEHPYLRDCTDSYKGFERHCFFFEGYEAIHVIPKEENRTHSWIYRTEFFGAFDETDMAMVEKGYHLIFLKISDQYGSLESAEIMNRFRSFMVKQYDLDEKGILFGFSRGGLYALSYTTIYMQYVSALYLDAPVVDIRSWPGRYIEGTCDFKEWQECKISYNLTEETISEYDQILEKRKCSLLKSRIPMILVAGDSDSVVPYTDNGQKLIEFYEQNNLPYHLILKEGVGHHPHSLQNPEAIVSFLIDSI